MYGRVSISKYECYPALFWLTDFYFYFYTELQPYHETLITGSLAEK